MESKDFFDILETIPNDVITEMTIREFLAYLRGREDELKRQKKEREGKDETCNTK